MDISKLDKNFVVNSQINENDIVWLDVSNKPFLVYGAATLSPFKRLTDEFAVTVSNGVNSLKNHTAGIRARFKTNSPYIAIHTEWKTLDLMPHMPISGIAGFDIYSYNNGKQNYLSSFIPSFSSHKGFEAIKYLSDNMADYVLNFPLYNSVDKLYIGIKKGSDFEKPSEYKIINPIVFYGSSITQGGCASRPGNCYQNFLSRELDFDYINLGFSGNAKGEKAMAEYIGKLKMSAFVMDYDHNAPDTEHLMNTHNNFFKIIREKNPNLPIIIVTRPDGCFKQEAKERQAIIFETYNEALKNGDKNVFYIDGASLFTGPFADCCTVDGCHPNDLGFYRFYEALLPILQKVLY